MSRLIPPIPPILSEDLIEAVSSLTRAAHTMRSVLFLAADDDPKVFDLIMKHEELVQLADDVINAWRQRLGHDVEDDEAET
jgi:hypothetical protein